MFKISCGLSGWVHVESSKGQERSFPNMVLDTMLDRMNSENTSLWVSSIGGFEVGQGVQDVHPGLTSLKQPFRHLSSRFALLKTIDEPDNFRYVLRSKGTVPKGSAWTFSEIGIKHNISTPIWTYAIVKDSEGTPAPMHFEADEEVTITYYFQVVQPKALPDIVIPVSDGRGGVSEIRATYSTVESNLSRGIQGEYATLFRDATMWPRYDLQHNVPIRETSGNDTWGAIGVTGSSSIGAGYLRYLYTLDTPLVKTNTQQLTVTWTWDFKNVEPLPVEDI